jgi:hypothetical protein
MVSSGILRHVALVRTSVSVETFHHNMPLLLVTANIPSCRIRLTLMMEAIRSSETLILTRAMWRNIPEGGILHSHRCENHKSYN